MKKKVKKVAKKRPLLKFFSYIASAVAGAMLFYFIMHQPVERKLRQHELAYYLVYELTQSKNTTVVDAWWEGKGRPNIPEKSLLVFTADGNMHAVHPDGKVTKHRRSGAFLEVLSIKMPDIIIRTENAEVGSSQPHR